MILTLKSRQPITPSVESFWFESDTVFQYRAGQYLRWTIDYPEPDERGNSRFFSIASAPTETGIMLATKFNPEGSSFKRRLKATVPGEHLTAVGPLGDFTLPEDESQAVILVAGGIGVTPFRSMLKQMTDSGSQRPVQLLYGARTEDELAFKTDLDSWSKALPNIQVKYFVGERVLGAEGIASVGVENKPIYLSGPQPMIEALKTSLELDQKIPESQIKTDYFPGYHGI